MLSVLMVGDLVGKPGRVYASQILPSLINRYKPDMVIANGENAAGGKGITGLVADEIYGMGVDVITTGNHIWDNRDVFNFIDHSPGLIRPANFPPGTPGKGWLIHEIRPGMRPVAVVNLMGRTFMTPVDCPFQTIDHLLTEIADHAPGDKAPAVIVDFHAEATSEKETMGFFLAGKVSAVIGTHTHVQTADERILPGGTAYITDMGMTGPRDSILGVKPEIMIRRFLYQMPVRHELAESPAILCGVLIHIDEESGKAVDIIRITEQES
ncbi:MAG: TIGR00282 family metallophosphoesterase [Peptococcaceae bacterium]|jgi:metallophosphoesterase (TIGR00282 family)|nr:TIGR00282 family metallophosphoesterase [Peptococcaceae bacterium]